MQPRSLYSIALVFGVVAVTLTLAYAVGQAWAQPPRPVKAPSALLKARKACPNDSSIPACRAALIRQIKATDWQKRARNAARAGTSRDVVLDAIQWASRITGVPAWRMRRIGECESHLYWRARNGQYLGAWQLGSTHRSDPLFNDLPWQDPYAQALHVARFIRAHGSGAWQCTEYGGLRW